MAEQINVFIIYAREDKDIKQGLLKHLAPLRDLYNLNIWHDDFIDPGQEWKPSIESRLALTDVFLLLVSADFMISEFIHQVEFKFAIDRHKQNKSIVVPIIIGYCIWDIDIRFKDYTFNLKDLQVLPDEGKPLGEWKTPEQAYNNIAGGIRKVLSAIKEKREQAIGVQAKKKKANQAREENASQQKAEKEKQERLQKQIKEQEEKEKQDNIRAVPMQANEPKSGSKKILYASLIAVAVAILAWFMFHNPDKGNAGEDIIKNPDTATSVGNSSLNTNNTDTPFTDPGKSEPKKPAVKPGAVLGQQATISGVAINSFNTFPGAFGLAFNDAPNNFANLKKEYIGMEDGMSKYNSSLLIRSKGFRPPYILQNGDESKVVFENENNSNYKSIQASIMSLLKTKNINYEYEPSASMAFDRYTWGNGKFEIYLSIRKYTDHFIELDFSHRN